jgi:hypothetical protein
MRAGGIAYLASLNPTVVIKRKKKDDPICINFKSICSAQKSTVMIRFEEEEEVEVRRDSVGIRGRADVWRCVLLIALG